MNRMTFDTRNKVENELAFSWIKQLLEYNKVADNDYNEIHIYQEESLIILEWEQVPYSREWGGAFQFIDEEHVIMKEVRFPDGHYEYLYDNEEEERLKEWLEENPGWVKTSYGAWTNEIENAKFREMLNREKGEE